jgi:hypothetical protein
MDKVRVIVDFIGVFGQNLKLRTQTLGVRRCARNGASGGFSCLSVLVALLSGEH